MQELTDCITKTWLLVKDKPDAKLLYASKGVGARGYSYEFRKVLIRKFSEVRMNCRMFRVNTLACDLIMFL